ncbi:hypothetical protein QP400_03595 [Winkia sp. UMB3158]|uniref:Uncharacterized protein n=1 Tax=Winkia neuii subsp. anitrata TaxID=29318 RepID=A0AB38XNM2_9ACTO|nr:MULTISPECIES: hypothetical protein [Winkia]MDK8341836.1 hypothetical protein [Winkia sp. UMB3164B]MBS5948139.1 hypothetical protein [Winkia neuii]MCG7303386.1 hypothetical protein [Winkia sp. ACRQY]MDK6240229.1 hypothetical protein [Winkia sp. UMB10116]MDK7149220.1 hypothetical protein [Winkia sp. UMB3158]
MPRARPAQADGGNQVRLAALSILVFTPLEVATASVGSAFDMLNRTKNVIYFVLAILISKS